jgi:hypothetical protein
MRVLQSVSTVIQKVLARGLMAAQNVCGKLPTNHLFG